MKILCGVRRGAEPGFFHRSPNSPLLFSPPFYIVSTLTTYASEVAKLPNALTSANFAVHSMLSPDKKKRIIEKYKTHATDTGSPQVQIAILTEEIKELTEHLKLHKKDFSSRRGLIKKVGERRRLMKYLKREDAKAYDDLMAKIKI